ncbi:hypothetical protein GCM10018773_44990 [Streptomyces candidus]|nr:hypothetical protein GCM10018773_44990 [Streptomyces candidus]
MTGGTVQYFNRAITPQDLTKSLTKDARAWTPRISPGSAGSDYIPCQLVLAEKRQHFTARVGWSFLPMSAITSGDPQFGWRHSAGDVYSSRMPGTTASRFALACQIPKAHEKQASGLPLWVWIDAQNIPDFDGELRENLASTLARTMSRELGCMNGPEVPAQLPS